MSDWTASQRRRPTDSSRCMSLRLRDIPRHRRRKPAGRTSAAATWCRRRSSPATCPGCRGRDSYGDGRAGRRADVEWGRTTDDELDSHTNTETLRRTCTSTSVQNYEVFTQKGATNFFRCSFQKYKWIFIIFMHSFARKCQNRPTWSKNFLPHICFVATVPCIFLRHKSNIFHAIYIDPAWLGRWQRSVLAQLFSSDISIVNPALMMLWTDEHLIPVSRPICRTLRWVRGLSSWLCIRSATASMLSSWRARSQSATFYRALWNASAH